MLDILLRIQTFYETYYLNTTTEFAEWAAVYGWLAAASFVGAILLIPFVWLRREQARSFVGLVVQHVLVIGIPWLIEPLGIITAGWL